MAELGGTSCAHAWGHPDNAAPTPLICLSCGVLWPGAPLPDPPNVREPAKTDGYVPWGQRVARMVSELNDLDVETIGPAVSNRGRSDRSVYRGGCNGAG